MVFGVVQKRAQTDMVSIAATVGLVSLGLLLVAVIGLLRQLGAGEAAKGLLYLTGAVFLIVIASTYVPALISGI
jgi:hypothetical protein